MIKRRSIFTAALVLAGAGVILIPLRAAAAPVDTLDRFAGTWHSQGTFVDSPYQKAGSASGTTTCAWSNDHVFMICQQISSLNGMHDSDVAIFTYDDGSKSYRFYSVRPGGTDSVAITVDPKTITYPGSFTDRGKKVMIRTVNSWDNPSLYHWRAEYSTDGGTTWKLMGSGSSQRQ